MKKIFTFRFYFTVVLLDMFFIPLFINAQDSVVYTISDAKGLIVDIKLYPEEGGDPVSVGPDRAILNYNGQDVTMNVENVPAGAYNKIRITFYEPDTNEAISDIIFGEQGSNRFSFVMNGTFLNKPFTYRSIYDGSFLIQIDPKIEVAAQSDLTLKFDTDPNAWLRCNNEICSPYEPSNASRIDRNIKASLKNVSILDHTISQNQR